MATSSKSEHHDQKDKSPDSKGDDKAVMNPLDLFNEPLYQELIGHFQHADFGVCHKILKELQKKFPEHPDLIQFEDELQMKMSISEITASITQEEKKQSQKSLLRMSSFAVVGTLVVLVVFFVSYYFLNFGVSDEIREAETEQLSALSYQAEQLLNAGQPQRAEEIIKKMITINPDYEELPELIIRSSQLLLFEENYQTALDLIDENKKPEALEILTNIEQEEPGLWDVRQQIEDINKSNLIDAYLEDGNAAYENENWDDVILAYENIVKLDPSLDDPLMKEQLLRSYINKILSLLDDEDTTMEDIVTAEEYYRSAIAMIPQSRTFSAERENLQRASEKLLELKFAEIAKESLDDINQTVTTVDRAVSFLKTSAAIQPDNVALQTDLQLAQNYQNGFKNFIELDWEGAIANFDKIYKADPNYADGNANAMLFEAYYALGKQYYSAGFYLDAISKLEQAEILTWYDTDNLLKLFQTQILLGDAFGKLEAYENAVSYYQYALNAINVNSDRIDENLPELTSKLADARNKATFDGIKLGFDAYQAIIKEIDVIYAVKEIDTRNGANLALIAKEQLSTVDAILEANDLPLSMVISFGRRIKVPTIDR